jgi:hypothetical protein
MATYSKNKLSGSTDGKQIKVTGTNTAGAVTVHTAVAGTTAGVWDEITLYAQNNDTTDRVLTIEWGGTGDPDDLKKVTVPALAGDFPVVIGGVLRNGLLVKAFADAANVVQVSGFVNEIRA